MLILTRKIGETLLLGNDIEVQVMSASEGRVKLGIRAPRNMNVLRKELRDKLEDQGVEVKMEKE